MKTIEELERENSELKKKVRLMEAEEIKALGAKFEKMYCMYILLDKATPCVTLGKTSVPIVFEVEGLRKVLATEIFKIEAELNKYAFSTDEIIRLQAVQKWGVAECKKALRIK